MKNKLLILLFLLLIPTALLAQEEEEKTYKVSISGFISSEIIYDTRQPVAAREGDVLLFTAPINRDANGDDINDNPTFNMVNIHSRFRVRVDGPEMFGAQSSALLESDFVGTGNEFISMMRLRHAIIKLDWENTSLLAGQYWHPFFVVSTYPQVAGWGGGIPYAILSRNPQVRFGFNLSDNISGSLTALAHRDFASTGPQGQTPDYLRNGGMPELNLNLEYHTDGFRIGAVGGYKQIMPRTTDLDENKLDETLGSLQGNIYTRLDIGDFTAKVQGLYGENMYNFVMMGGYAEFIDQNTGDISYSNYRTGALWTELLYTQDRLTYSLFGGYSENYGTEDTPSAQQTVNRYGRGNNIDTTYRIAPRLTYTIADFQIMGEISYNATNYGSIENDGTVSNTEKASAIRTHIHLKYSF